MQTHLSIETEKSDDFVGYHFFIVWMRVMFHFNILHLLKKLFIFGCLDLHCCTCALSSCGAQAAHCDGFSCCRGAQQWALGCVGSLVAAHRLSNCSRWAQEFWHTGLAAPQQVESSHARDGTRVPCNDRSILHQWTMREVQSGHY